MALDAKPHGRPQALRTGASEWAQLREKAGLSQRDLEAASGISRGIISLIESNRLIPRPGEARALLEALDVAARDRAAGRIVTRS